MAAVSSAVRMRSASSPSRVVNHDVRSSGPSKVTYSEKR